MEEKSKFAIIQLPEGEVDRVLSSIGKKKEQSDEPFCKELVNNKMTTGTGCQCNTDGTYTCSDDDIVS